MGMGMRIGSGVWDGGGGDFLRRIIILRRTNREILTVCLQSVGSGCAQANVRDLRGGDAGSACAGTVESGRYTRVLSVRTDAKVQSPEPDRDCASGGQSTKDVDLKRQR